jgi:beta-galactosidase
MVGKVENPALWHIDTPNLYTIRTEIIKNMKVIDTHEVKIGFRKAEFRTDGFYLNGEKLKLRGLNRHQSYPYIGYAAPKTMQEFDADVLKNELGLNTVRTSHYPQSHHFINRCDEIGLLVITEIPGWQHIGNEEWQNQAVKNVEEMILQYRNHPSIILWGVRINESQDNDELYLRTNNLAHLLDSTRSTCGVRNFKKSHLLEDVYTYNEFIHDGKHPGCDPKKKVTSDMKKPYMITEYNGHMFPTKSYDCEEHRVEHALRHARVLDAVASYDDIAGSCGWCMADYNTHKDFGSGDRICYHGVLDMFRNPKLAAAAYSSQGDVPMLEVGSSMDIGEHPACVRGNLWMFTNADSVKMYKNGKFIKEYFPKSKDFPHLKNSPILIDDFIGDALYENENFKPDQARTLTKALNYIARHGYGTLPPKILLAAAKCILLYGMKIQDIVDLYTKYAGDWGGSSREYRFDAIMQGKVVKSVTKSPMNKPSLKADVYKNDLLDGDCYDMTTIRITATDEYGNILNYSNEPITVSVTGPVEVVGPSVISLRGGMTGTYIKTVGKEGPATVTLSSPTLGEVTLPLTVKVEK